MAWGGFSAHIAPRNGQSTLTSPGGDVIHLANRGILFIPRATVVAGEVIATMTPTHSNTSLFVGFSGPATASLRNIAYWWKKLGGKRCDQFDKVNDMSHDILRNGTFAKLLRAFESSLYDCAFFSPPCHTFSICRFRYMSGFPVLRDIQHVMGLPSLTGEHRLAVTAVNTIVERMCALIMVMHRLGKDWCVEALLLSEVRTAWFTMADALHGGADAGDRCCSD